MQSPQLPRPLHLHRVTLCSPPHLPPGCGVVSVSEDAAATGSRGGAHCNHGNRGGGRLGGLASLLGSNEGERDLVSLLPRERNFFPLRRVSAEDEMMQSGGSKTLTVECKRKWLAGVFINTSHQNGTGLLMAGVEGGHNELADTRYEGGSGIAVMTQGEGNVTLLSVEIHNRAVLSTLDVPSYHS